MAKDRARHSDDPCPQCGGAFVVDTQQDPAVLVARKRKNAQSPVAAERFAVLCTAKAAEFGVIHRCASCDYRARFHAAGQAA